MLVIHSHSMFFLVMRLEKLMQKTPKASSSFAHTAVLWDAIAPQSSFQTKVRSESSFCHALRCWYKLEIEIGLISSLNRVRGGIPSEVTLVLLPCPYDVKIWVLWTSGLCQSFQHQKTSFPCCWQWRKKTVFLRGTHIFTLIKSIIFFLLPILAGITASRNHLSAHQISTCSCGRSPSLHDRRKGNRSTSCSSPPSAPTKVVDHWIFGCRKMVLIQENRPQTVQFENQIYLWFHYMPLNAINCHLPFAISNL